MEQRKELRYLSSLLLDNGRPGPVLARFLTRSVANPPFEFMNGGFRSAAPTLRLPLVPKMVRIDFLPPHAIDLIPTVYAGLPRVGDFPPTKISQK